MKLDEWLKENAITRIDFAKQVGCCRQTIIRVDRELPISERFANKIAEITTQRVIAKIRNPGCS